MLLSQRTMITGATLTQPQAPTSWRKRCEFECSQLLEMLVAERRFARQSEWSVLASEDLRKSMQRQVEEVAGVLNVSSEVASLLLRSFGCVDGPGCAALDHSCAVSVARSWNKEKFVSRFVENPSKMLSERGLQVCSL
jgi:hypothetical protein